MDRRQMIGAGAGVVGAAAVGYALLAPVSDRELIAELLDELADALSFAEPIGNVVFYASHLSERFEDLFTEQVQIRVSEVRGSIPSSRGKLGLAAAKALSRYGSLDVSFSLDDLTVRGDSAECQATASVLGNLGGEPKSDSRPVNFALVKDGSTWLIASALVSEPQE